MLRHFWILKSARAIAQIMTECEHLQVLKVGVFNSGEACSKEESLVVLSHDVIFKASV